MWDWLRNRRQRKNQRKRIRTQQEALNAISRAYHEAREVFWPAYMRYLDQIQSGCSEDEFTKMKCPICRAAYSLTIDLENKSIDMSCSAMRCSFFISRDLNVRNQQEWWDKHRGLSWRFGPKIID